MQEENEQQEPQEPQEAQEPEAPEPEAPEPEAAPAEAAEEPAAEPAAEAPADEAPAPSPKQRRKQARAHASGPAQPQRSAEDRARERAEARSRKAAERTRWRGRRKSKIGDSGIAGRGQDAASQAAPSREPGKRKVRQGVVLSNKGDKTITVRIDSVGRHRVYGRVIRSSSTLHAHDEQNQAGEGDVVRVVECRPLSRTKRWRLVEILERAR